MPFLSGQSTSTLELDEKRLWHPFTPVPWVGPRACIVRAEGPYLFDDAGKKYFDATSSWWCNTHGHCHPRLVQALYRQAMTLDQMLFSPHTHPVATELASRLVDKLGTPFSRVFYSDNGSTAVEAALKMALQFWRLRGESRTEFVSLQGGYHGDTLGAMSVGSISQFSGSFPKCFKTCAVDITEPKTVLAALHEEVAALILEPIVMGARGMAIYPKECLSEIVRLAKDRGILVIYDEVFTGFGRTGPLFAMQYCRERPDIVCLSKGLTAGMLPLAATVTTEEIFREFCGEASRAFYHGHTFTANSLGCAVALESLLMFDDENVLNRNEALSRVFKEVTPRFVDLPDVVDVRTIGVIWAMELKSSGRLWDKALTLWEKGIWIRPLHNVVYVVPPYVSTPGMLLNVMEEINAVFRKDA